jgi:tetratricopeptide (TPR) repeat protein
MFRVVTMVAVLTSNVFANDSATLDFLKGIAEQPIHNSKPHAGGDPHAKLTPKQLMKVVLQHHDEGRYDIARIRLNQAINKYPKNDELLALRASLLMQENKNSDALRDLESAIITNPNNPEYYLNRYVLYHRFWRFDEALKDLNKAIELDGGFLAAYFNRGSFYFSKAEFDKALEDFNQCVAISPHTAACYFNRASTYKEIGKHNLAVADLEHFLTLNPQQKWQDSAKQLLDKWQK